MVPPTTSALDITPALVSGRDGTKPHTAACSSAAHRVAAKSPGWVDRVGCFLILMVTLPVLVLAGIAVLSTSAGPVMTRSAVIASNGRTVFLRRFRTTYRYPGLQGTLDSQPRGFTPVGLFLRRSGIARLPMFMDVWAGKIGLAEAVRS